MALGLIGSALSFGLGKSSAKKARRAQEAALAEQRRLAKESYDKSSLELQPYKGAGLAGQNQLSYLLGLNVPKYKTLEGTEVDPYSNINKDIGNFGQLTKRFSLEDFQEDPSFKFRQSEGEKAINRAAAAKGRFASGGALKELTRYGSDLASQEYGNAYNRYNTDMNTLYNRLLGSANQGAQTAGAQIDLNTQYANQMMGNAAEGGNSVANYATALGNLKSQGLADIGSSFSGLTKMLGFI